MLIVVGKVEFMIGVFSRSAGKDVFRKISLVVKTAPYHLLMCVPISGVVNNQISLIVSLGEEYLMGVIHHRCQERQSLSASDPDQKVAQQTGPPPEGLYAIHFSGRHLCL